MSGQDQASRFATLGGLAVLLCLAGASCRAQDGLARRSVLGITAAGERAGLVVQHVAPASTADQAGVHTADTLRSINGRAVSSPSDLSSFPRLYRAGSDVSFTVLRDGAEVTIRTVAVAMPLQTSGDYDVLYQTVYVDGARLRAILTKPKPERRYPAVFLIGGLGCYSLDPLGNHSPYGSILNTLTKDGFVTMRVDKSGEGDSEGPACDDARSGLQEAADRSIAGIKLLRDYPFVDASRVFVFAHSIGPLEGALVVGRVPITGFIASETIGRSWFDYQTEIYRTQPLLLGDTYQQVEQASRVNTGCMALFYLDGLSSPEAQRRDPRCAQYDPSSTGVPLTYFQGLAALDLPQHWASVDIPVLVTYGTSDPLTDAGESRYFEGMINSLHPGRATYQEFAGMSHHFDTQPDKATALRALQSGHNGPNDASFVPALEGWMRSVQSAPR